MDQFKHQLLFVFYPPTRGLKWHGYWVSRLQSKLHNNQCYCASFCLYKLITKVLRFLPLFWHSGRTCCDNSARNQSRTRSILRRNLSKQTSEIIETFGKFVDHKLFATSTAKVASKKTNFILYNLNLIKTLKFSWHFFQPLRISQRSKTDWMSDHQLWKLNYELRKIFTQTFEVSELPAAQCWRLQQWFALLDRVIWIYFLMKQLHLLYKTRLSKR